STFTSALKESTILLGPCSMRVRYLRMPSRPRLTSALCQVTTALGWKNVSSRSMSPLRMASSSPSRKARSSLWVASSEAGAEAAGGDAGGGAAGACASRGRDDRHNRDSRDRVAIRFFVIRVFMVSPLGQGCHPLEKVDHVLVVRPEASGLVTGGAQA